MKRLLSYIAACLLAGALALALALPGFAVEVGPQPGPLPESPSAAARTDGNAAAPETPALVDAAAAPRYFLTNIGQSTTAKIQKPWGACWAFAVAGAIESSILKAEAAQAGADQSMLAPDSPAFAEPAFANLPLAPDVSERAMAWFAHEPQTEASGGAQSGEGYFLNAPSSDEQLSGGNFATAASALTAWQSLVSEEAAPYEYNGYAPGLTYPWYGSNPAYDARLEDWSLADELRSAEDLGWRVDEVLRLESPALTDADHAYTGYDEQATAAIKRTLVDVGGVAVALAMEQNIPADVLAGDHSGAEPSQSFTFSTWSQFDAASSVTQDHAAVIVGWDDAHPASSFQGTESGQPPADGAWLCKNSWGNDALYDRLGSPDEATRWGLVDAQGQASGYFWLSYHDHTIADLEAFAVTPVSESYQKLYQHDYVGASEYVTPVKYQGRVQAANVFTAQETELIQAVTAWTFQPNTRCAVTVGVLPAGFDRAIATPDQVMAASTPLSQAAATFSVPGFHTLELDTPALVVKEQSFTLTLEILAEPDASQDGEPAADASTYLGLEVAYLDEANPEQTTSANVVANEGETFVCIDGTTWMSIADLNAERASVRSQYDKEVDFVYGNAITKALANVTTMASPERVYEVLPLQPAS